MLPQLSAVGSTTTKTYRQCRLEMFANGLTVILELGVPGILVSIATGSILLSTIH